MLGWYWEYGGGALYKAYDCLATVLCTWNKYQIIFNINNWKIKLKNNNSQLQVKRNKKNIVISALCASSTQWGLRQKKKDGTSLGWQ